VVIEREIFGRSLGGKDIGGPSGAMFRAGLLVLGLKATEHVAPELPRA